MKKLYFKTQHTNYNVSATLISLGIVADSGEEFYAEFTDFNYTQIDEFHRTVIFPNLFIDKFPKKEAFQWFTVADPGGTTSCTVIMPEEGSVYVKGGTQTIVKQLIGWLDGFKEKVRFYGDTCSYDWVLFCQMFGGAMELPLDMISHIPIDLSTRLLEVGYGTDINREEYANFEVLPWKHYSLRDAYITKACFERLLNENYAVSTVLDEVYRQKQLWGEQNHEPAIWISILTEEVGETAKEANELNFDTDKQNYDAYIEEMVQVAAVAVSAIQSAKRNYPKQ